MQRAMKLAAAVLSATGVFKTVPSGGRYMSNNKYGHLTWMESRPENTELRHRNEAGRARAREARRTP